MDTCYLPEELVILILERLPLASARRFQSVCKSWRCIISATGFLQRSIVLQSKRRETSLVIAEASRDHDVGVLIDPSYTVLESPTSPSPTEFGPLPRRPIRDFCSDSVVLVGSCGGIVCLAELLSGRCVLWNPTTGESRALPDHDHHGWEDIYFPGFGHYDGDYKVVKISKGWNEFLDPIHVGAQIYELSLDSWREISPTGINIDEIGLPFFTSRYMACWRDGSMYSWIGRWNVGSDNRTAECTVVSFDMTNETFTNFGCAPVPFSNDGVGLFALNDLLALWCCHSPHPCSGEERSMDIWVLLQHGVWTKLWTIRVGPEPHWPLEFWNGGLVMAKDDDDRLLWCNPSISPRIIQTLPVIAFPCCSCRGNSRVVAIEKTHGSLESDRTT